MTKKTIELRKEVYINRHKVTEKSFSECFDVFIEGNPLFKKEDLSLEIDYSHSYYDSIDIDFYINAKREETDEEYEVRLAKEAAKKLRDAENAKKSKAEAKKRQEAKDLEEYKRLRKKFKDKIKDMHDGSDNFS